MYFHGYFLLVLCFLAGIEAQSTVTVTNTLTQTDTTVVVVSTRGICIQPVNATTVCRRRRQYWVDHPVVLSFDDDDEFDNFEMTYQPHPVLRVEPTRKPASLSDIEGRASNRRKNGRPYISPPYRNPEIEPSFESNRPESRNPKPVFGAQVAQIVSFISSVASSIANVVAGTATTTTVTVTSTTISTFSVTVTTSTQTLVVANCIPPGLNTYSTCPAAFLRF